MLLINWTEKWNFSKIKESTQKTHKKQKPTVNIGETLQVFPLKLETKEGNIYHHFYLALYWTP